ncbi:MAG: methyltransferase domain-containing protein, partial [Thermotogaceae bacterium]|nr:methyltransferase domain-containing protein [Thermotogaceae bacterium]
MREIVLRVPRERAEEAESLILVGLSDTEGPPKFNYYLEEPDGLTESVFHLFAPEPEAALVLSWIEENRDVFGKACARVVVDDDWSAYYIKTLEPYWLTKNVLVDPFVGTEREILLVRIACGKAFGIGDHSTTRMAVELLQKYLKRGQRVLDVGYGTGILSILASKWGARSVTGFDIDPDAVREARGNARLNQCDPAPDFREGDYVHISERVPFDIFVSNIYVEVLEEAVKASLNSVERTEGSEKVYILSGILETKWRIFDKKMRGLGLCFVEKR